MLLLSFLLSYAGILPAQLLHLSDGFSADYTRADSLQDQRSNILDSRLLSGISLTIGNNRFVSDKPTNIKFGLAFEAKVWVDKRLGNQNLLSLGTGIGYTIRSASVETNGLGVLASYDMDYVSVPFHLAISPVKWVRIYGGLQAAYKVEEDLEVSFLGISTSEASSYFRSFDAGLVAGVTGFVPLRSGVFTVNIDFFKGMIDTYKSSDLSLKNQSLLFGVGYVWFSHSQ